MKKNLIGKTFGLQTVISEAEPYRNPKTGYVECAKWLCQCECGNAKELPTSQLTTRKNNYGCGCKGVDKRISKNNELGCMEYTTRQGKIFLFDECDLDIIKSSSWYIDTTGYVCSNKYGLLHRNLMNVNDCKEQVDHINGDRSDNRRCNLRVTDNQHNCWNSGMMSNNTSGHKHVSKSKYKNWRVRINKDGKEYAWYTDDYDEACRIAEEKHKEMFGEYSVYNNRQVV